MKKKLQKVIGVLSTMKDFNMKPNFSELERDRKSTRLNSSH